MRPDYDPQGRQRRFIFGHQRRLQETRHCYACDTTKSIQKGGSQSWTHNIGTPYFLCKYCRKQIIDKQWNIQYKSRRILFKGKRIRLYRNPRKGICQLCNKKGLTNIHHIKYDDADPLAYIIELCIPCHTKEGLRIGQLIPIN